MICSSEEPGRKKQKQTNKKNAKPQGGPGKAALS